LDGHRRESEQQLGPKLVDAPIIYATTQVLAGGYTPSVLSFVES
jgi:hypothetical protein